MLQHDCSSPLYSDMFGEESVDFKDKSNLSVTVDGKTAYINLETRVSVVPVYVLHFKIANSSSFTHILSDLTYFQQDLLYNTLLPLHIHASFTSLQNVSCPQSPERLTSPQISGQFSSSLIFNHCAYAYLYACIYMHWNHFQHSFL